MKATRRDLAGRKRQSATSSSDSSAALKVHSSAAIRRENEDVGPQQFTPQHQRCGDIVYPLIPLSLLPHKLLKEKSDSLSFFPRPSKEGHAPFLGEVEETVYNVNERARKRGKVQAKTPADKVPVLKCVPKNVEPKRVLGFTSGNLGVFEAEFEGKLAAWKPAHLRTSPAVLSFNSETKAYRVLNEELHVPFVPELLFSGIWQREIDGMDEKVRLLVMTAKGAPNFNTWTERQAQNVAKVYQELHESYHITHGAALTRNILFAESDEVFLIDWPNLKRCTGATADDPLLKKERFQVSQLIDKMRGQ